MKNALLAVVVVTIVILSTLSASASWDYQWSTGFTGLTPGTLTGQDGWIAPTTSTLTNIGCTVVSAGGNERYVKGGPTGASQAADNCRDLKYLNPQNSCYYKGYADFRMYDPNTGGTEARALLYSGQYNPASTTTSSSFTFGARITDFSSISSYWGFFMGGSFVPADGSGSTSTGGGYGGLTFTAVAGQARPRTAGWHNVSVSWNYTATTCRYELYVDDMVRPCVTADFSSQNSRWANMRDVAGIWIGTITSQMSAPAYFDDISFYGNAPEPSSFMALGAGMIGLLGLIRRRR